jgi:hypothetical protein
MEYAEGMVKWLELQAGKEYKKGGSKSSGDSNSSFITYMKLLAQQTGKKQFSLNDVSGAIGS